MTLFDLLSRCEFKYTLVNGQQGDANATWRTVHNDIQFVGWYGQELAFPSQGQFQHLDKGVYQLTDVNGTSYLVTLFRIAPLTPM